MSGGSFNYLCRQDLVPARGEVENMLVALREYPESAAAVRQTELVIEHMNAIATLQSSLGEVWKAVEWNHSGDWGSDVVSEALAEFRS